MKPTGKSFNLFNKPTDSTTVGGVVTKDDTSTTAQRGVTRFSALLERMAVVVCPTKHGGKQIL